MYYIHILTRGLIGYFMYLNNYQYIGNHFEEILSPLDQFEIRDLLNVDIGILGNSHFAVTNIFLYISLATIIILSFNAINNNFGKLVPNV
jgi:hypothetical protein